MKRLLAFFLGFCALSGSVLAECKAHFHGRQRELSTGLVTGVEKGAPCTISVYLSGSGRTSLAGVIIVRPPQHGSLTVEGASLIYTPNRNFAGTDAFFVRFPMKNEAGERRKGAGIKFKVTG
ncbi:MAG: hypothetical protein FD175_2332 [Beijerinckiaceae bacterium]|nr:MAG: hypothetical protein FD175_2332 [Beijerinckiaceae bacterium]